MERDRSGGGSWSRICVGLCNIERTSLASVVSVSSETVGKDSSRYSKHLALLMTFSKLSQSEAKVRHHQDGEA